MSDHGTAPDARTLRFERLLPGPIERVWEYLTDSDKRGTWLARGAMELEVGGRVEHVFHNSRLVGRDDDLPPPKYADFGGEVRFEGRIVACEPPSLLVYTWGESSGEDSEVTFELTSQGDRVRLVLTHRRIATRDELIGAAGGWHTHLGILADRLAGRAPEAFWATHTRLEDEYERRIPR